MLGFKNRKQQKEMFFELLKTNKIVNESYHTPADDTLPRC